MSRGPLGVSSSRLSTARMVSPWWKCSRWFCSRYGMIASASRNLFSMMTSLPRSICWTSPREQLADLGGELVADPRALALADALDDALLGGLHGERGRTRRSRHLLLEHVADLEVGILVAGLLQRDLPAGILDRLDHLAEADDLDGRPASRRRSARTCTFGPYLRRPAPPGCRPAAGPAGRSAPAASRWSARGTRPTSRSILPCVSLLCARGLASSSSSVRAGSLEPSVPRVPRRAESSGRSAVQPRVPHRRRAASVDLRRRPRPQRHVLVVRHRHDLDLAPAARAPRRGPARADRRSGASAPASAAAARCRATTPPARTAARPSRSIRGSARGTG